MHRQAREPIITLELIKLERRQAIERARRGHTEPPQVAGRRRCSRQRPPA